ncbi:hypothetical protein HDU77_010951 [Chytriomyces hyalinus]|nr:hypothetical protein HDU77_010951 [Chytriomyces hyalinus]
MSNDAGKRASETMRASIAKMGGNNTITLLFYGVMLAVDGCIRSLSLPIARKRFSQTVAAVVALMFVLWLLALIATLPLRIIRHVVWGAAYVGTGDTYSSTSSVVYFDLLIAYIRSLFFGLFLVMPDAILYLVRYYFPGPMDKLFHHSLESFTSEIKNTKFRLETQSASSKLSPETLNQKNRQPSFKSLSAFIGRYWARFRILILVQCISFVPIIGRAAWPTATFMYTAERFNWPTALLLFLTSLTSRHMHNYIRGPLLRTAFQIRALARELVEPYLSKSRMTSTEKSAWLTRNEIVMLGFTGPLFLVLCVPILGPAVYFALANSASARLCLELFDEVDLVEGEDSIPGVPSRGLCEPRLEFMYGGGFFNVGLDVAGKADVLVQKFVVWLSVKAEDVLKRFEAVQYVDMCMQKVAAFLRKLEGRELERRDSGVKRE